MASHPQAAPGIAKGGPTRGGPTQDDPIRRAHPLLDPFLPSRHAAITRHWLRMHRELRVGRVTSPEAFVRLLPGAAKDAGLGATIAGCLGDVDRYLDDILRFLPAELQERLRPTADSRATDDPSRLLAACVEAPSPRRRYEAQRKLYLGKLLFCIDHSRAIRDGRRHQDILARHLEASLLSGARQAAEKQVCYRFQEHGAGTGAGAGRLQRSSHADGRAQCWQFHPRVLPATRTTPAIEILHHRCRFKREAIPAAPAATGDGSLHLGETERWPRLGRRSGSILSKMIHRGISDPRQVQDVLGAMFIVADHRQVYALEERLLAVLGGPAWVRDRTDTLHGERDRDQLSARSAPGFEVLKATVDLLVEEPGATPYQFGVELQIYPLTSYLATIHDAHYASHAAYKRRQLLQDVLPVLFPAAIFGRDHLPGSDDPAAS